MASIVDDGIFCCMNFVSAVSYPIVYADQQIPGKPRAADQRPYWVGGKLESWQVQ